MEKNTNKKCKASDLVVSQRYSLSNTLIDRYVFIVRDISDEFITIEYLDGFRATVHKKDRFSKYYEFPLSSLEKELL